MAFVLRDDCPFLFRKYLGVLTEYFLTPYLELIITAKLNKTDGCGNVRHVHFVTRFNDVVPPVAGNGFSQRIFVLPVKCFYAKSCIDLIIIKRGRKIKCDCSAFCSCEIFYSVK